MPMDMSLLVEVITTVGFPITICLILMYYVKYTTDSNKAEVEKITDRHHEEMKEVTKAIENNTLAITKLVERLGNVNE